MSIEHETSLDDCRLIKELERIKEIAIRRQATAEHLTMLDQLAFQLSSYIPAVSDSTLFEIDDLIYGDVSGDVVGTGKRICSEVFEQFMVENCYKIFLDLFFFAIDGLYKISRTVEIVFLQLLEHVSDYTYKTSFIMTNLRHLMVHVFPSYRLERFLKVLKVAVDHHGEVVEHQICQILRCGYYGTLLAKDLDYTVALLWMLQVPYESEHPNDKRRASWVSEQSASILKKLQFDKSDIKCPLTKCMETIEYQKEVRYNSEFTWLVLFCAQNIRRFGVMIPHQLSIINHLFKYFMSAQDKTQKIQRLHDFIKGAYVARWDGSLNMNYPKYIPGIKTELIIYFTNYSKVLVEYIHRLIRRIESYQPLNLIKFERNYDYDIGLWSYLPKDIHCSSFLTFKEETVELMKQYFENSNNLEVIETSEEFVSEKEKALYHEFMKGLQILDILHAAWLKLDDIIVVEDFFKCRDAYIAEVFRSCDSPIKMRLNKLMTNPSEAGRFHFVFQVVLRNCPFLFLSHHDDSHMENLIRMLKGKNIGKAAEEMIYFALN